MKSLNVSFAEKRMGIDVSHLLPQLFRKKITYGRLKYVFRDLMLKPIINRDAEYGSDEKRRPKMLHQFASLYIPSVNLGNNDKPKPEDTCRRY